ncbi:MAG: chromosome partitioning protein, partial [Armatimonadota bacterium]
MEPTSEDVLAALRSVIDPDLRRDIVTLGFVKDVRTAPGEVYAKIELTTPACPVKEELKAQAVALLSALPGIERVEVEMTAQVRVRSAAPADLVPDVKHIIAIASGKGG